MLTVLTAGDNGFDGIGCFSGHRPVLKIERVAARLKKEKCLGRLGVTALHSAFRGHHLFEQ